MTVNRVIPVRLIYCPDCKSRESWQRFPEKDMKYAGGWVFEFAYKCRWYGKCKWQPTEPELKG